MESGIYDGLLIGNSGYPCKTELMTPLTIINTPAKERYQSSHIKTRNIVERNF
ncbi:putative nuclease HARBI1-like protein, partial [Dinothrombium tinctorium]